MITTLPTSRSQVILAKETVNFDMKANSEAFAMLIDKVYENKVKAVLAELGQNAMDAHVSAGNKNPFDIKLPTSLDPFFYIRDYGDGMSHDFLMGDYCVAFHSTKGQSNKFSGAYGIGRLSALSISRSYNLISYNGKTQKSYSVTLETGIPQIHFLGQKKSNELTGVKISFAVPQDLINNFSYEAQDVFQFYDVIPNFLNKEEGFIVKPKYILSDEVDGNIEWGIMEGQTSPKVVMGFYSYDLSYEALNRLEREIKEFTRCPFLMKFKIGELDVTSNRQSLSYSEKTYKAIKQKSREINAKFKQKFKEKFSGIDNYFDACHLYGELNANNFSRICSTLNLDNEIYIQGRIVKSWFKFDKQESGYSVCHYSSRNYYGQRQTRFKKTNYSDYIKLNSNTRVLINDKGKKPSHISAVCDILYDANKNIEDVYIISFASDEDKDRLVKEYGLWNIEGYKQYYDQVPKTTASKKSTHLKKCLIMKPDSGYLKDAEVDLVNESFVFCCASRGEISYPQQISGQMARSGGYVNGMMSAFSKLASVYKMKFIIIKAGDKNKIIKDNAQAIPLDQFMLKVKKDYKQEVKTYFRKYVYDNLEGRVREFLANEGESCFIPQYNKKAKNDVAKVLLDSCLLNSSFLELLGVDYFKVGSLTQKIKNKIFDKYPILTYINSYNIDKKLVDLLKKN